jgi:hypothetical protein
MLRSAEKRDSLHIKTRNVAKSCVHAVHMKHILLGNAPHSLATKWWNVAFNAQPLRILTFTRG